MKTIVTHINPDLDAIASVWLLKRFGAPEYRDVQVVFVPAGATFKDMPADSDPDIVHVDTGLGKLDHHQSNEYTCAAKKVHEYLKLSDPALARLIDLVVAIDHAKDLSWPDAADDRWELLLPALISGYRLLHKDQWEKHMAFGMECMDAMYRSLKGKVEAEVELIKGKSFATPWGNAVACETYNDSVLDIGIRQGLALVVRKDPAKQYLRITGSVDRGVDLTSAYAQFQTADPDATWYLHPSKVLLRNGSTKNPKMRPTKLSIDEIIGVLAT